MGRVVPLSQSRALCQGPGLTSIPLELSSPVPWPFQGLVPLPLLNGLYKASAAQSQSAQEIQVNFPWELLSLLALLLLSEGHEK